MKAIPAAPAARLHQGRAVQVPAHPVSVASRRVGPVRPKERTPVFPDLVRGHPAAATALRRAAGRPLLREQGPSDQLVRPRLLLRVRSAQRRRHRLQAAPPMLLHPVARPRLRRRLQHQRPTVLLAPAGKIDPTGQTGQVVRAPKMQLRRVPLRHRHLRLAPVPARRVRRLPRPGLLPSRPPVPEHSRRRVLPLRLRPRLPARPAPRPELRPLKLLRARRQLRHQGSRGLLRRLRLQAPPRRLRLQLPACRERHQARLPLPASFLPLALHQQPSRLLVSKFPARSGSERSIGSPPASRLPADVTCASTNSVACGASARKAAG
jgi:hypothetical protein